jgi:hypothetical protein
MLIGRKPRVHVVCSQLALYLHIQRGTRRLCLVPFIEQCVKRTAFRVGSRSLQLILIIPAS